MMPSRPDHRPTSRAAQPRRTDRSARGARRRHWPPTLSKHRPRRSGSCLHRNFHGRVPNRPIVWAAWRGTRRHRSGRGSDRPALGQDVRSRPPGRGFPAATRRCAPEMSPRLDRELIVPPSASDPPWLSPAIAFRATPAKVNQASTNRSGQYGKTLKGVKRTANVRVAVSGRPRGHGRPFLTVKGNALIALSVADWQRWVWRRTVEFRVPNPYWPGEARSLNCGCTEICTDATCRRSRPISQDEVSRRLIILLGPSAFICVYPRLNLPFAWLRANRVRHNIEMKFDLIRRAALKRQSLRIASLHQFHVFVRRKRAHPHLADRVLLIRGPIPISARRSMIGANITRSIESCWILCSSASRFNGSRSLDCC